MDTKEKWIAQPEEEMKWGKGRKSKAGTKLALLLSGDDGNVQVSLFVPIVASVAIAFPGTSEFLLDQTLSITSTFMIIVMLFSSTLAKRFDKKHLIMLGTAIFAISGLALMLAWDIYSLLVIRAIIGIGAGLAFPLVPSAISYLFSSREKSFNANKEKDEMMGWMNAAGAFFGFTFSLGAGYLGAIDWRLAFVLYAIFIPIFFLQWYFLPNFKPEKDDVQAFKLLNQKEGNSNEKKSLGVHAWVLAIGIALFMCVMLVANYKLALYIVGNNLGGSGEAGLANSCNTMVSFLFGVVFVYVYRIFKGFTPVFALAMAAIGGFLLANATNLPMIFAGMGCGGAACGTICSYVYTKMSEVAPPERMTWAMSLLCICTFLGNVLAPFYIQILISFNQITESAMFGTNATLYVIAACIVFVYAILSKKKS